MREGRIRPSLGNNISIYRFFLRAAMREGRIRPSLLDVPIVQTWALRWPQ